jgi:hypothetical protein
MVSRRGWAVDGDRPRLPGTSLVNDPFPGIGSHLADERLGGGGCLLDANPELPCEQAGDLVSGLPGLLSQGSDVGL